MATQSKLQVDFKCRILTLTFTVGYFLRAKTKQNPKTKQIKKKTLKKSETVANDFIIGDIATVDLQGLCVCSRLK